MKKYLHQFILTLGVCFGLFQAFGQNLVTTYPSSNSSSCDGYAVIDSTVFSSTSWYWMNSNGNVVQQGGYYLYNLCPGTYILNYGGANGTNSYTFVIDVTGGSSNPCANSTLAGTLTATPATDPSICDGTLTANITGGAGSYTYSWSNASSAGGSTLTNLCIGTYVLTVVDGAGCSISLTGTVTAANDTTTTNDPCANTNLTISLNALPSNSAGACTGEITATVTGGAQPYVFNWVGENGFTSTTYNLTNICPGTYILYVTDANGCSATQNVVVTDNSSTTGNCNMYVDLSTVFATANNCDGQISATVYGGDGSYTYFWNNGSTTPNQNNLCTGIYYVTVADNSGCSVTASAYVGENFSDSTITTPELNGYVIPTGVSVDGVCDGTASTIVYGGTAPYSFSYSNGTVASNSTGLCQGLQSVTITDAVGATLTLDFIVPSASNTTSTGNYSDSTVVDSLYSSATVNCDIIYSSVDSAFIASLVMNDPSTVSVTWTVVYNGTSSATITQTYTVLNNANGVYTFVLQLYCTGKSIENYLVASDQYYLNQSSAGVEELEENTISVYPNPFNKDLFIVNEEGQSSNVSITDMTGKVIYSKTNLTHSLYINTESWASGSYLLVMQNQKGTLSRKLMK